MLNDSPNYLICMGHVCGTGLSGCVYTGTRKSGVDPSLPHNVAVKCVKLTEHADIINDISNEIEILSRLRHPNIVSYYGSHFDMSNVYVFLQKLDGGDLYDREVRTEERARNICRRVVTILRYLHDEVNIVHRDIKPGNIMFANDDDSSLTLIDFGFAAVVPGEDNLRDILGTAIFMAPEIWNREPYGRAVDMWAMGVMVYTLLSGLLPFGEHIEDIKVRVNSGYVNFNDEQWDLISDKARDFIRQLLRCNPASRPTAAKALEHPWLREAAPVDSAAQELTQAAALLKKLNVRLKFQKVVHTIIRTLRWQKMAAVPRIRELTRNASLCLNHTVEQRGDLLHLQSASGLEDSPLTDVPRRQLSAGSGGGSFFPRAFGFGSYYSTTSAPVSRSASPASPTPSPILGLPPASAVTHRPVPHRHTTSGHSQLPASGTVQSVASATVALLHRGDDDFCPDQDPVVATLEAINRDMQADIEMMMADVQKYNAIMAHNKRRIDELLQYRK